MVLRGGESVRQELVHNIDMAKAFNVGQAAIRSVAPLSESK